MGKARREFIPEFKCEAVALLESSGRPQIQIAAELRIQPSMLRQWRTVLTLDEARRDLFAYIEGYDNQQRIHSALGYITPEQAERNTSSTPCP